MSSEMNADANYVYAMPAGLKAVLLVGSCGWVKFNDIPLAPLGLLIAVIVIAQKYDFTYFSSLRRGWRMLASCGAIAALSFVNSARAVGLFR